MSIKLLVRGVAVLCLTLSPLMASTELDLDLGRYKLGWSDAEDYVFKPKRGLDENQWFNNVEIVTAEKIGMETTTYVRNIYKYYVAYTLAVAQTAVRDEVEAAWQWIDPIRAAWQAAHEAPKPYTAGTWGPSAAVALIERDGRTWHEDAG